MVIAEPNVECLASTVVIQSQEEYSKETSDHGGDIELENLALSLLGL
jgi:hypothetical protein